MAMYERGKWKNESIVESIDDGSFNVGLLNRTCEFVSFICHFKLCKQVSTVWNILFKAIDWDIIVADQCVLSLFSIAEADVGG